MVFEHVEKMESGVESLPYADVSTCRCVTGVKRAMTRPAHAEVQAGHDRAEVWFLSACASTVTLGTCVTRGICLPNVPRGGSRSGSGRPGRA